MSASGKKLVLNAGAGNTGAARIASMFPPAIWSEVRLDIDPRTSPDIVGSFADMHGLVEDARFDAVYSSHAIEHLYAHEVIPAFREFRRVLKPDGFALVTCPDLMAIARQLLDGGAEAVAYRSPAGPIRPIDMLYGHSESIGAGQLAMAHNTGFTGPRLARVALVSGFSEVRVIDGAGFDLWGLLLCPQAALAAVASVLAGQEIAALVDSEALRTAEPDAREFRF
jgi:SAM-dependent methyltransferase